MMGDQEPLAQVEESDRSVKPFELFFDLVFVYGFTQVTGALAADLSFTGLVSGGLLMAALWLAWQAYTWLGTAVDLDEGGVRLTMLVVMGGVMVLGLAAPGAFGEHAVIFAVAFAFVRVIQLVLFTIAARHTERLMKAVARIVPNATIGPALILIGAVTEIGPLQVWWAVALVLEYGAMYFIDISGFTISPKHFSERHGLIFIISLGETIISIGIGAAGLPLDRQVIVPCLLALSITVAMWWNYFDVNALAAERRLAFLTGGSRVRVARDAYSYLHLPMVGGAILSSLAAKKILAHTDDPLALIPAIALAGGLAVFLLAQVAFSVRCGGPVSLPRLIVAGLLLLTIAISQEVSAQTLLLIASGLFAVLVIVEVLVDREARHKIRTSEHHTWGMG